MITFITSILPWILLIVLFAERLGKLIPDSKAGVLGSIRKALKVVGGYVENVR